MYSRDSLEWIQMMDWYYNTEPLKESKHYQRVSMEILVHLSWDHSTRRRHIACINITLVRGIVSNVSTYSVHKMYVIINMYANIIYWRKQNKRFQCVNYVKLWNLSHHINLSQYSSQGVNSTTNSSSNSAQLGIWITLTLSHENIFFK